MAFISFTDAMVPYVSLFKEGFCDGTFQTCGTSCFYQKVTVFGTPWALRTRSATQPARQEEEVRRGRGRGPKKNG